MQETLSMDALPNRKYLLAHSTMQSLCLDNNLSFCAMG